MRLSNKEFLTLEEAKELSHLPSMNKVHKCEHDLGYDRVTIYKQEVDDFGKRYYEQETYKIKYW